MLAEIEAPDLDQQLLQARGRLASPQANAELAEATLPRAQIAARLDSVSKQDVDESTGDLANKQAGSNPAQANVDRLRALEEFKRIVAPFDGVVTARDTDVGALINAGGGRAALFVVSDTSKLRVYVNVPQNYVPRIKIGTKAEIRCRNIPDRTFLGTVEASAGAVDGRRHHAHAARGRQRQGRADARRLRQRAARPAARHAPLHIPAGALIFDQNGLRVATVGPDDKVVLKTVTIARDLGRGRVGSGLCRTTA